MEMHHLMGIMENQQINKTENRRMSNRDCDNVTAGLKPHKQLRWAVIKEKGRERGREIEVPLPSSPIIVPHLCIACSIVTLPVPLPKTKPQNITANTWHMHLQSSVYVCVLASIAVGIEEFSMNNWTQGEKHAVQKVKCQLPVVFLFQKKVDPKVQ